MATLNWIGKDAVANHDKEVPFKLLKKVRSASVGEHSQNLIIHGDNLEALKALMPYYVGKVKCIYIDPPYNTGNEGWVYNDKVNSPKIRQWLGKVVGGQLEDLTRHDKWLCMMYPRLKLLRDLLSEDGVIFISIDDNEHHHLRLLMNEIFGEQNIEILIWNKEAAGSSGTLKQTKTTRRVHEYILCGYKNYHSVSFSKIREALYGKENVFQTANLAVNIKNERKDHKNYFTITNKYGDSFTRQWKWSKTEIDRLIKSELIYWGSDNRRQPRLIIPTDERRTAFLLSILNYGGTTIGRKDFEEVMGHKVKFAYPKPVVLLKKLIATATRDGDIVLDSFAGSGTTAQAVLEVNRDDSGTRKFILIEMEDDIAEKITAERVKRAIKKYVYKDGFEYCELDKPLFNEHGQIEETCDFKQFATYIYFTETQTNIDSAKIKGNYIGEQGNMEYYLIYKEPHKNDLDKPFLKKVEKTGAKKIVYADRCMLDESELAEYNLVFKQIPYEVKIY